MFKLILHVMSGTPWSFHWGVRGVSLGCGGANGSEPHSDLPGVLGLPDQLLYQRHTAQLVELARASLESFRRCTATGYMSLYLSVCTPRRRFPDSEKEFGVNPTTIFDRPTGLAGPVRSEGVFF